MNRRNLLTLIGATALTPLLPKISAPIVNATITPGVWTGKYEFQWFADGIAIPGGIGNKLTLTEDNMGKNLSVRHVPTKEP